MVILTEEGQKVSIPNWVTDIEAFRRWVDNDEVPEKARIWWLRGEVWVDMSKEQVFSHVAVKTEYTVVLGGLVKTGALGLYLTDGVLLTNFTGEFSDKPDSMFLSNDALVSGAGKTYRGEKGRVCGGARSARHGVGGRER